MNEPMKNQESQHQKVENKSKEFCGANRMVMGLAHYLKSEKYHLIICELSESKT